MEKIKHNSQETGSLRLQSEEAIIELFVESTLGLNFQSVQGLLPL